MTVALLNGGQMQVGVITCKIWWSFHLSFLAWIVLHTEGSKLSAAAQEGSTESFLGTMGFIYLFIFKNENGFIVVVVFNFKDNMFC